MDLDKRNEAVITYKRKGLRSEDDLIIILNMTPVVRMDWQVDVWGKNVWEEIFNSDRKEFWGTGDVYNPAIEATMVDEASKHYRLRVHLPALAGIVLR